MERAILDGLTDAALQSLAQHDALPPAVLNFLLRRYLADGEHTVCSALGLALAECFVLAEQSESLLEQAEWTDVFVEAGALSDDSRLDEATASLLSRQRRQWASETQVGPLVRSIEAALRAGADRRNLRPPDDLMVAAIDRLEALIGRVYRPGFGVAPVIDVAPSNSEPVERRLEDQLLAGSALATAFRATGRLPYAMLAEELLQFARRTFWDDGRGLFGAPASASFSVNCEAVRLMNALADLHRDSAYRHAAVMAADADYDGDASRVLRELGALHQQQRPDDAARFGIVLSDWLAARSRRHEPDEGHLR